ncbi:elongation factor P maturation arginine rhamnosyltransferase EarP, partial [Neisseria sicca]|uniref:elongation factor P maturation arginine rhamnosyltransferase EarP n=1 Tax=Neisseria sicca TaxID=490 RepID=UPI0034D95980
MPHLPSLYHHIHLPTSPSHPPHIHPPPLPNILIQTFPSHLPQNLFHIIPQHKPLSLNSHYFTPQQTNQTLHLIPSLHDRVQKYFWFIPFTQKTPALIPQPDYR